MNKEKISYSSSNVKLIATEIPQAFKAVAEKIGLKINNPTLALFRTIYAHIGVANGNGIILSDKVKTNLDTLPFTQVNFEHLGAGFICGTILDAKVNDKNEIEVIFSFFKDIYPEEYKKALEKLAEGKLSVSFELYASKDAITTLPNGNRVLDSVEFSGMGFLLDSTPADKGATVFEMAKKVLDRISNCRKDDLVFASKLQENCQEILKQQEKGEQVMEQDKDQVTADKEIKSDKVQATLCPNCQEETDMPDSEDKVCAKCKDKKKASEEVKEEAKTTTVETTNEEKTVIDDTDKTTVIKKKSEEVVTTNDAGEVINKTTEDSVEVRTYTWPQVQEAVATEVAKYNDEKSQLQAKIQELEAQVESIKSSYMQIAQLKLENASNPYVKEFADMDYLNEEKLKQAKLQYENDTLKAKLKASEEKPVEDKPKEEVKTEEKPEMQTGHVETKENSAEELKVFQAFFKNKK